MSMKLCFAVVFTLTRVKFLVYIYTNPYLFSHNQLLTCFRYIFKRLKFLGNKHISQAATLFFLAIWHGFQSGYFMNFFLEFFIVNFEREVSAINVVNRCNQYKCAINVLNSSNHNNCAINVINRCNHNKPLCL